MFSFLRELRFASVFFEFKHVQGKRRIILAKTNGSYTVNSPEQNVHMLNRFELNPYTGLIHPSRLRDFVLHKKPMGATEIPDFVVFTNNKLVLQSTYGQAEFGKSIGKTFDPSNRQTATQVRGGDWVMGIR